MLLADKYATEIIAPAELEAVMKDLGRGQRAFMSASRDGGKSMTRIDRFDGSIVEGESHFFSGRLPRLREIRPGYTAIIVGDRLCYLQAMDEPSCGPANYYLGLPEIDASLVADAKRHMADCAFGECLVLEIATVRTMSLPIKGKERTLVDSDAQIEYTITIDPESMKPVSVVTLEYRSGSPVARAEEIFDLDAVVDPIELPITN